MTESTTSPSTGGGTPHASLAALGCHLHHLDLFAPVRRLVQIPQKVLRYSPADKLFDGFIALLAGAHGFVEINTRLRSDPALQAAFGRSACAEQSVVQDTLDAATPSNVTQMEQALDEIFRTHSRGYRHDYGAQLQLLDVDMSGQPCGPKAAFATKGYFARQRNRRGRQLGRVVASHCAEIVVDRLFAGTTQLNTALPTLLEAAETTLQLSAAQRARTLVRLDAGGGSQGDVNWLLARHYRLLGKEYSTARTQHLAESVTTWVADPRHAGREVGWVTAAPTEYHAPVQRLAVRCRKKNGQWGVGVLITNLSAEEVAALNPAPVAAASRGRICWPTSTCMMAGVEEPKRHSRRTARGGGNATRSAGPRRNWRRTCARWHTMCWCGGESGWRAPHRGWRTMD